MVIFDKNGNIKDQPQHVCLGSTYKSSASGIESWYMGCRPNAAAALSNGTPTANLLYCYPFFTPSRPINVDRLAIVVTTSQAASNARVGIYTALSGSVFHPGELLVDTGALATTSNATFSTTVSVDLDPDTMYFLVYVNSTASVSCRASPGSSSIGGTTLATNPTSFTVPFTYAALPTNAPRVAPTVQTANPVVFMRFSN